MQHFRHLAALALPLILAACAFAPGPHQQLQPSGGSRADGVVQLTAHLTEYTRYTDLDLPEAQAEALALARERCQAWGYVDAKPFSGYKRQCTQLGGLSGCAQYTLTREYQCLGAREPTADAE